MNETKRVDIPLFPGRRADLSYRKPHIYIWRQLDNTKLLWHNESDSKFTAEHYAALLDIETAWGWRD